MAKKKAKPVETDVLYATGLAFPALVKKIYRNKCRISQVFVVGRACYKVHFYYLDGRQMKLF
jgi:hypothetical protein